nr:aminotransferase class I/II-fold pyridoxal phosphate-dependent enzyme [Allomuricauda sp.]
MPKFPEKLDLKLQKREEENALRTLKIPGDLIDFSSNDYLGFSRVKAIQTQADECLEKAGLNQNGASGSRLLTGNHALYDSLESFLAKYHDSESALVFNSGYDANIGFFSSVPQKDDFIFFDELVHASIRDGIVMSKAKSFKFAHNNLADLQKKIERTVKGLELGLNHQVYIVTESVFSMDGDSPDLMKFSNFCTENGFYLVVDEAHAVGLFGEGKGLVVQLDLQEAVFARVVTFGKALGAHGAAVLGSKKLKDYLVNFARSLIYTTGLPPHTVAVVISGYEYLQNEGRKKQELLRQRIDFFKSKIKEEQLEKVFIPSDSAIHCMVCEGNEEVKRLSNHLVEHGFDVKPILSPTVKKGEERLRFCMHAYNTQEEIENMLEIIMEYI